MTPKDLNWVSDDMLKTYRIGKVVFYTATGSQKIAFTAPTETAAWSFIQAVAGPYRYNITASANAGYPIYYSADFTSWVSHLGNRLEINLSNGRSVNVHLRAEACIVYADET